MERNLETGEIVLSRSEFSSCVLTLSHAMQGEDNSEGEVEDFFNGLTDPDSYGVNTPDGTVRGTEDGKLALDRWAAIRLLRSLASDIFCVSIVEETEEDDDVYAPNTFEPEELQQIKTAGVEITALFKELSSLIRDVSA